MFLVLADEEGHLNQSGVEAALALSPEEFAAEFDTATQELNDMPRLRNTSTDWSFLVESEGCVNLTE